MLTVTMWDYNKTFLILLETNVEIINQDALKPLNIKKQDIVISDVPFGYYADEDNSLNYKLCSTDGYSLKCIVIYWASSKLPWWEWGRNISNT